MQFYKDVVGRDLADTPDWAAPLDGSRGDKISTHLVINDGYYFEDMGTLHELLMAFREYVRQS